MKKTYYFNTGVKPESGSKLFGCQVWKGGTKQIPFICEDVPDNATFLFACDNENLPEAKESNVVVKRILDNKPGGLVSNFAYFRVFT